MERSKQTRGTLNRISQGGRAGSFICKLPAQKVRKRPCRGIKHFENFISNHPQTVAKNQETFPDRSGGKPNTLLTSTNMSPGFPPIPFSGNTKYLWPMPGRSRDLMVLRPAFGRPCADRGQA